MTKSHSQEIRARSSKPSMYRTTSACLTWISTKSTTLTLATLSRIPFQKAVARCKPRRRSSTCRPLSMMTETRSLNTGEIAELSILSTLRVANTHLVSTRPQLRHWQHTPTGEVQLFVSMAGAHPARETPRLCAARLWSVLLGTKTTTATSGAPSAPFRTVAADRAPQSVSTRLAALDSALTK